MVSLGGSPVSLAARRTLHGRSRARQIGGSRDRRHTIGPVRPARPGERALSPAQHQEPAVQQGRRRHHGLGVGHPLVVHVRAALGDRPAGLVRTGRPGRTRCSSAATVGSSPRTSIKAGLGQRGPQRVRRTARPANPGRTAPGWPRPPAAPRSAPCTSVVSSSASARCASRACGRSAVAFSSSSISSRGLKLK